MPGRTLKKLLIVDDEEDLTSTIAMLARATGKFEVQTSCNGKEALNLVRDWGPDMLLIDMILPQLDGLEVCRRLRLDPRTKSLPTIIMSAEEPRTCDIASRRAGADAFVSKPFDNKKLLDLLESLAGRSAL